MLPYFNAPKNIWEGKSLQLIMLMDRKLMICTGILLIEMFLIISYLIKNSNTHITSYIATIFIEFAIIFAVMHYAAREILYSFLDSNST